MSVEKNSNYFLMQMEHEISKIGRKIRKKREELDGLMEIEKIMIDKHNDFSKKDVK